MSKEYGTKGTSCREIYNDVYIHIKYQFKDTVLMINLNPQNKKNTFH